MRITDCTTLNNGVRMPWLGLGVFQAKPGEEVRNAVKAALETGYRAIDTAAGYRNEEGVGEAIRESGIPRDQIFVTTKLANSDHGFERAREAFHESLERLGMDYVDLFLIHWPIPGRVDSWKAFEKIAKEGKARAIGVSNFTIDFIEELKKETTVVPAVNQVEFHPFLLQPDLLKYCKDNGIQLEAYSPLVRAQRFDHPTIQGPARKHGKSPAQILIRWDLQHEVVTIPKSVHANRIKENADVFDFELSADEVSQLDALDEGYRTGADPVEIARKGGF
jgi:methylglyoxal/glyoxal reductase